MHFIRFSCRRDIPLFLFIFLFFSITATAQRELRPKTEAQIQELVDQVATNLKNRQNLPQSEQKVKEALALLAKNNQTTHPLLVQALNQVSLLDALAGRPESAVNNARRALTIVKQSTPGVSNSSAFQTGLLGKSFLKVEKLDSAKYYLQKSNQQYATLQRADTLNWARNLSSLGDIAMKKGQINEAEILVKKSLNLRRAVLPPNHLGIARGLMAIGSAAQSKGDYTAAREVFQKAIQVFSQNLPGGRSGLARVNYNLAMIDNIEGKIDSAIFHGGIAVENAEIVFGQDNQELSMMLDLYGAILALAGRAREGIPYLLQSRSILEKVYPENSPRRAGNFGNLGVAYMNDQQFGKALKSFMKTRASLTGYPPTMPFFFLLHVNTAFLHVNLDRPDRALQELAGADNMLAAGYQPTADQLTLYHQATAQVRSLLGHYDQAYYSAKYALELNSANLSEPNPTIGDGYFLLATLRHNAGRYRESVRLYQRAATNFDISGSRSQNIILARVAASESYRRMGKLDSARLSLEQALALREEMEIDDNLSKGQISYNMGMVEEAAGNGRAAMSHFQQALKTYSALYPRIADPILDTKLAIGRSLIAQGRHEEGRKLLVTTIQLRLGKPGSFAAEIAPSYYHIYRSFAAQDWPESAAAYLDSTLLAITSLPPQGSNPLRRRASLIDGRGLVNKILDQNARTPELTPDRLRELFSICDFLNYNALRESLREDRLKKVGDVPDALLSREEELRALASVTDERIQALELLKEPVAIDSLLALRKTRVQLQNDLAEVLRNITIANPAYARLLSTYDPIDPQELRRAIGSNKSLLEYYLTKNYVHIFLIQDDEVQVVSAPLAASVDALVGQMVNKGIAGYHALPLVQRSFGGEDAANKNYTEAAHKLYQMLVLPVVDLLNHEELVIVAHGNLSYLPFETLLSKPVPEQLIGKFAKYPFLLHDYTFSYGYSAAVIVENKRSPVSTSRSDLLALAPFPGEKAGGTPTQRDDTATPLPFSRVEVNEIAKSYAGDVLIGEAANIKAFREKSSSSSLIHLATHANANYEGTGDFSYISLRDAEGGTSRLYANDLYATRLNAKMVVLSACQSGVGNYRYGEGIISLARAFTFAGAESVFSTLWKVEDQATSEIVKSFYQNLKKEEDKDIALRNAKLAFIADNPGRLQHPFYWAAMIGTGRMGAIR